MKSDDPHVLEATQVKISPTHEFGLASASTYQCRPLHARIFLVTLKTDKEF
jgi:hypothetical protein